MDNDVSSKIQLGFSEALTILFVALKLLGIISWSWWWVICPIPCELFLSIIVLTIAEGFTDKR